MTATSSRGLTLDTECPNTTFIREFAFDGLWRALTDFGCGPFEGTTYYDWYWRTSQNWPALGSQATFNTYARERLSDKVGYTRRQLDAWNVIDTYFDKGSDLTLDDVLDAVAFCSPTQPLPKDKVFENDKVAVIDVTVRKGCDQFLKVDREFLPVLTRFYPWERIDTDVIKTVRVGTVTREFNLLKLAFWFRYPRCGRDEMMKAIEFHSADRLDWTSANLYSRWREGLLAEKYKDRVDPVPPDQTARPVNGIEWIKKPSKSALLLPMGDPKSPDPDA